ncbi:MAG: Glu-tRNA(Gln) amidotransferase subunit GatD [Candidatus Bathyarchaeia archaeon]
MEIGDEIRVVSDGTVYEGVLAPRVEYGGEDYIVVKLRSGYNIGIRVSDGRIQVEKLLARREVRYKPPVIPESEATLPSVAILGTGGTIASRVDYRTGAVTPIFSADDLYGFTPELAGIARIDVETVFNIFSEDMTPRHWSIIASRIGEYVGKGVDGVVVTHGTDTMGYTAAALSFALRNLPIPVVLVGAQRSPDRPSSDAALNLIGAVTAAARAPFAEVAVAMHRGLSDDEVVFHRGTRVRKCHTSRRDAFKSINSDPIAVYRDHEIEMLTEDYRRRGEGGFKVEAEFEERVALIKFYPGFDSKIIDQYVDNGYRGIVIEGTGLGHVSSRCIPSLKRAVDSGVFVGMTSQCLWGRINMNVYRTGRELQAAGVLPLEDMLPETALVKLMWVLARVDDMDEARRLMLTNIAGEIFSRTSFRWYA